ncbi:MAG: lytic transglycosylase domain-containing protein, partial [Alphaproteobacteria bacterium]
GHAVVEDGCWLNGLYARIVPSQAIELTAVFLDRNVAALLARRPNARVSARHKQDLAALIHLCGAGPAKAFALRGYHLTPGERCGDHDAATYLARVDAMKRQFLRLAANR